MQVVSQYLGTMIPAAKSLRYTDADCSRPWRLVSTTSHLIVGTWVPTQQATACITNWWFANHSQSAERTLFCWQCKLQATRCAHTAHSRVPREQQQVRLPHEH